MNTNFLTHRFLFLALYLLPLGCSSDDPKPDVVKAEPVPQEDPTPPADTDLTDGSTGDYSVDHLLMTAEKATRRYTRLAIANSVYEGVKTWKTSDYVWAKLTYLAPASDGESMEKSYLYLACHFHGTELGCHKKDDAGSEEPDDL